MAETIKTLDTGISYRDDMVKYLIIVNRRRAFPEIKDGLKPVQRRVLYDMFLQGATSYNKRIKSSAITGDTQGKFHPHGDVGIYPVMEPLANWYSCKVPLIAPHGGWGSLAGDKPAAARYTEAGLSEFCYECVIGEMRDNANVVDWVENYNRTTKEPEYLPVKVPLLLINGSFGIGVGMNTNIPSHNLVEVLEETRKLIKDPNHKVYLVPDNCQPCKILGERKDFQSICDNGYGKYKVRGRVTIEMQKDKPVLRITSLPDNVTTTSVTDKLDALMVAKQLPMVQDFYDESNHKGVNISIVLRKGADPNYVKEILYAKCNVQTSVSVNFEVVEGTNPGRFSYKAYLQSFIQERAMTKFRLYCNKLKVANTRWHQLTAYIKLIESGKIDDVIKQVKKQTSIDDNYLIEYLIKAIHVTDLQAKFILNTDIRRLSKGYLEKYKAEFAELEAAIPGYKNAITDDGSFIMNEIDQELLYIEQKYGTPRLCEVKEVADDNNIPRGTFKIVISRRNYIRKIPDTDKVGVIRGDDPKFILKVENTENILIFDNKGKCFKMPVNKIPVTDKQAAGTDIRILCKNLTADIIAVYYEPTLKQIIESGHKHYIAVVTKNNAIKKLDMEDFLNVSVSGLMYSKTVGNDEVSGIAIVPAELDIVIFSQNKALRTSLKNIPLLKRNSIGSKAMNTSADIEGLSVVYPNTEYIAVVTRKGKVNKFPISGLQPHDRARAGINVIKLGNGDEIKCIFGANDTDQIRIVTSNSVVEVPVSDIKVRSSVAAGDNIPLKGSDIVRCDLMWQSNQ